MTKAQIRKEKKKNKRIEELGKEIRDNDEILRKNHEEEKDQVQLGLCKRGYPPSAPMYDSLIERTKLEIEEKQIVLNSKFRTHSPTFDYQVNTRWKEIQNIFYEKNVSALKAKLELLEGDVKIVKADIAKQNERIKLRRIQIVEELKKLGEDTSELTGKVPSYIG